MAVWTPLEHILEKHGARIVRKRRHAANVSSCRSRRGDLVARSLGAARSGVEDVVLHDLVFDVIAFDGRTVNTCEGAPRVASRGSRGGPRARACRGRSKRV